MPLTMYEVTVLITLLSGRIDGNTDLKYNHPRVESEEEDMLSRDSYLSVTSLLVSESLLCMLELLKVPVHGAIMKQSWKKLLLYLASLIVFST